jgi:hypothetical protein
VTVLMCAAAVAARPPTEVSRTQTAAAGEQTLTEAKCPHGKHPVSGGYEFETTNDTFMFNSAEGIDLRLKRWSVNSIASPEPGRVTVHAYCSPLGRKIEFRNDRTDLNQGDEATITATCKRDERVLSGSYAFVSSGLGVGIVEDSFRPDPRSWSIRGINFGDNKLTMIAFAHCVPKQNAPKLRPVRESMPFPDEGPTSATATCDPGRYALTGGFKVEELAFMSGSLRVGARGWRVDEPGGVNGRDTDLTAIAYCAKK